MLSRFRHPNIIGIVAFASDATAHCILLELCERGTLAAAITPAGGEAHMSWALRVRSALGLSKARLPGVHGMREPPPN